MNAVRLEIADAVWSPQTGLLEPAGGAAAALDVRGEAVAFGPAREIEQRFSGLPRKAGQGVLLPGLVDCHAHLECAALASKVPGGDGLGPWVSRLVQTRMPMTKGDLEAEALRAAKEMRALGTVAVADVCTLLATAPILGEAGLMGLSLLEVVGANEPAIAAALQDARLRSTTPCAAPEVIPVLVPHSAYGTMPGAFAQLKGQGGVRSVHAAEHEDENAWLERGEGPFAPFLLSKGAVPPRQRPLPFLDSLGALGSATLLVHLVTASDAELRMAADRGATAVLCPRSNLHIGGRLPDLRAIRAAGIPYVLGTDSLASTPDHDLLGEVAVLAEDFPDVPADELLEAATTRGAQVLGLTRHPWVRVARSRLGFLVPRTGAEA
ncbi:amidohydrolase family protein [Vulgatibacter sp.]|uniref:amidohydrolase family protein n=1 Tax=Vulgatibacter sp. TaxID=1971226 RepID=UPI003565128E